METLSEETTGRYVVTTASGSRYLVDLDRLLLRRLPAMDMARDRSLRRDGQDIPLLAVPDCTVGRPMDVALDLQLPGVLATNRRTTDVVSIEPIGSDAGDDGLALLLE